MSSKRDPLERAIRNIKIATFNVILATCFCVAAIVLMLAHYRHAR